MYGIDLRTSSDTVLTTLTESQPSSCITFTGAFVEVTSLPCITGPSLDPSCDLFVFQGSDGSFLELATPLNFIGGPVFPLNAIVANAHGSFAGFQANMFETNSAVNSGSIQPIPEPTSRLLLAAVLLGGVWINRRRRGTHRV
jgi:hypothetical protein